MTEQKLTVREYCLRNGHSINTYYRAVAAGLLPPPERVGVRSVRVNVAETDAARRKMQKGVAALPKEQPPQPVELNPVSDLEAAAAWLANHPSPPHPVIPAVRQMFGLTAPQACEVAARAFELRAAR